MSFERMISNLINNAVEACDKNSGIIDVLLELENGHAKIIVKDNGVGIPKRTLEKIRACSKNVNSTKHEGQGLGLNQILSTIESYEGTVEVESDSNGTTFSMKFPIIDCPEWLIKQLTLKKGDVVVILDDNPSFFAILEEQLKCFAEHLTLKFFTSSKDALKFIESFPNKEKIFFLSDYELRESDFSGLIAIMQSNLDRNRTCIFSSIHGDKNMHDISEASNVKILLKQFLKNTPVVVE
jgi:hypothetical protein